MDRKALALALISTAAMAGCAGEASDADEASAAVTSFSAIGDNSACASPGVGRSGEAFRNHYARVRFSESAAGTMASLELYDATTGLLAYVPDEYQVKRVSSTEIELTDFYTGETTVRYRLTLTNSGGVLTAGSDADAPTLALKCDLRSGGPSLKLPVSQAPASTQPITGSLPPPPDHLRASCTATSLVRGEVAQLQMAVGEDLQGPMFAHAYVYDAKTHFIKPDLLPGRAKLVDHTDSFGLEGTERYGSIVLKGSGAQRHLTLVPEHAKLKAALGSEVPLNCDFVRH